MTTPATPIVFTLSNQGLYPINVTNITYVDDSNIQHHSDYSNFAYGGSDQTADTSLEQYTKQYVTGDYLEKVFVSDTHDRTVYYSTHTGSTLTIKDSTTSGLDVGWIADGNGYTGLTISSISYPYTIVMSGSPSIANPIVGGSIIFYTNTNKIVLDDTAGIQANWQVIGNGYTTHASVISVEGDGQTLIVDTLPTNPTVGNTMLFTTSTNYLTLNNTSQLAAGWTADGNGYNGTQYVVSVINGNTVQMSDQPNSTPTTTSPANQITFTNNIPLITLAVGSSTTFTVNYTNNTSNVGASYPSALTIDANQNSTPIIGYINNFVSINTPPPPPPTYVNNYTGGGGGGDRGGGGFTSSPNPGVQGGWGAGGTDGFGGASSTGGVSSFA